MTYHRADTKSKQLVPVLKGDTAAYIAIRMINRLRHGKLTREDKKERSGDQGIEGMRAVQDALYGGYRRRTRTYADRRESGGGRAGWDNGPSAAT